MKECSAYIGIDKEIEQNEGGNDHLGYDESCG